MAEWITIKPSDALSDGPQRKSSGHSFISPKGIAWLQYCRYCGHIALKNWISALVTKIGCNYERDQRYVEWRQNKTVSARH